jgi:predicted TIM-barrel fold metal-dependent hydrolase
MAIIDLDSHLRDGWFLDEIYKLDPPFAGETPRRIGNGALFYSKFEHALGPEADLKAIASFKNPVSHTVFYDPKTKRHDGEIARWQQGGYDMEYRMKDNAREKIDMQFVFPTQIDIAAQTPGELGIAACRAYNDWVHKLVSDHQDRLFPVAMTPARTPEAMA